MAKRQWVCVFAFDLALLAQPVPPRAQQQTTGARATIAVRTVSTDGVSVQYLSAGSGPAIALLHGYVETSHMCRPLIPRLAATHTVIAPDVPGIGGSAIPSDGLDMTHATARMHALVKSLGVNKAAAVVGHDIGLMVAYAYAAQFPGDVDWPSPYSYRSQESDRQTLATSIRRMRRRRRIGSAHRLTYREAR